MAILNRPYKIPNMVLNIHNVLNELYDDRFDNFLKTVYSSPLPNTALRISVTNRCNLSCKYCYDKMSQPPFQEPVDMDPKIVQKIFANYPNPSNIFILGGEPFLNPSAVIAILKQFSSSISISTNGQILNNDIKRILSLILQRNKLGMPTMLQVSCEEGGVTIDRSTKNVEKIIKNITCGCGRFVKIKYTLTQPNIPFVHKIAKWYWDRKMLVQFDFADGGYGEGHFSDISEKNRILIFEFISNILHESFLNWLGGESDLWALLQVKVLLDHILPDIIMQINQQSPIWSMCGILGHSIYIGPKGSLYPCHRIKYSKQDSYGLIGDKITEKIVRFHCRIGPAVKSYCKCCIWRGCCGGICPSVIYNYGNDMLQGRCKFFGAIKDAVWAFLTDDEIISNPKIDDYLKGVTHFSLPFNVSNNNVAGTDPSLTDAFEFKWDSLNY